jgi:putative endonuclease
VRTSIRRGLSADTETALPLGRRGELYTRRILERKGWTYVTANWYCASGELDLVMWDRECLVFVEVKTRRGDGAGRAEEGISARKSKRLLMSGEWFLSEHPEIGDPLWRIDLVAITVDRTNTVVRVSHLQNAVVIG